MSKLLAAGAVITDGAWGTQLHARGLSMGECPDQWNLTHPDKVEDVARAYVRAGSQVILSNTFGANRIRLAEFGLAAKAVEINRVGAQISKRAAGASALVFASIGPTGKMLCAEEVGANEVLESFTEQAHALKQGGADGLVIETMAELDEARLAVQAAKSTGLPVVACLVFDTNGCTMMGVSPEQAARELTTAGADVIGSNCGNGIEAFVPICEKLHATTDRPIWIKANAGLPEMVNGNITYKTTPGSFASYLPALREAGASFIGGCCGTTPAHIAALAELR